jgi:hypothetical protein
MITRDQPSRTGRVRKFLRRVAASVKRRKTRSAEKPQRRHGEAAAGNSQGTTKTNHVSEIARNVGASLAQKAESTELVSFEILRNGNISVERRDGEKFTIAAARHAPCGTELPRNILLAEQFLKIVGPLTTVALGARPEGRRFFQRMARDPDGKPCVRFSEAGRDV